MTIPSPEEVAKEIVDAYYSTVGAYPGEQAIARIIFRDRSRLIQYIREKMQELKVEVDKDDWSYCTGRNEAIEAVEKLLEGIK